MEGHLWKMATSGKRRWARRYFVLKDGFILYYAARAAAMTAFDVHPKGVIPLGGCSVASYEGGPTRERTESFRISHPAFHGRALVLCADTAADNAQWMKAVMNCRLMCARARAEACCEWQYWRVCVCVCARAHVYVCAYLCVIFPFCAHMWLRAVRSRMRCWVRSWWSG
jgi:hypothetical protein